MSPRPVLTPSAERVQMAYAREGETKRAAAWLGMNYRTLQRRLRSHPALLAAADRGRVIYKANRPRPPHGTVRGYTWELRHRPDVTPCGECLAANAADSARRQGRQAARPAL